MGQINWMSFTNAANTERKKDRPNIRTNRRIKTKGRRSTVDEGVNWNMGIIANKTPKVTIANIAEDVVVTSGKNSLLMLIDFIIPPLEVILERPPEVPRAKIWKIIIPVIR